MWLDGQLETSYVFSPEGQQFSVRGEWQKGLGMGLAQQSSRERRKTCAGARWGVQGEARKEGRLVGLVHYNLEPGSYRVCHGESLERAGVSRQRRAWGQESAVLGDRA